MSNYSQLSATGLPPPPPPPQSFHPSIINVLGPGIISLFVQGLETGLVFSQFAQWLSLDRKEGITITLLVLFVTTVGFLETALCFASAWRIYVRGFGQVILFEWTESVHAMLSTITAAPIQAYFIYRCYHIVKNAYLIIPLVAVLVTNVVAAGWITAWIFHMSSVARNSHTPPNSMVYYPFVVYLTLPAALDITITSILLHSLIKFLRRIHAEHLRRRVVRYIVVTWQAVIPPCLCAVALLILYLTFTNAHPGKPQLWYPAIQAMLGKLYVLSLYYTLNNRMDLTNEPPPLTYVTTVDAASFDSVGEPTRRFVLTLPLEDRSDDMC